MGTGVILILMSSLLYETEEGAIQNRLEQWWIVLVDAEPRAVDRHAAFVANVAALGSHLFDRLFGSKLFSVRSLGVSACFSLASLGVVCSPGLSGWLIYLPSYLYALVVILLLLMGVLPAVAGPRWPRKSWLVGVAILTLIAFLGMDTVDWFNVPVYEGSPSPVEAVYYLGFVIVTIASDSLFIVVTRWLLRTSSRLNSKLTIIGLMLGNVSLAGLLVLLPVLAAWGFKGVSAIIQSHDIVRAVNYYVGFSTARQCFLATLAASNTLDGIVACTFFIVLFVLLVHRLIWPTIQRPVYALASWGIVRRRKLFFVAGLGLIGVGGLPESAVEHLRKFLQGILDL
jgi:hypothetical protein